MIEARPSLATGGAGAGFSTAEVRMALSGDRGRKERLMRALLPAVRRAVRRLRWTPLMRRCAAELDAEDLVQEVLLFLLEQDGRVLRRWDPARGSSLERFCGCVALNRTRTLLRQRGRGRAQALPPEQLGQVADGRDWHGQLVARQQLRALLQRLRARYGARAALYLGYLAERPPAAVLCAELGGIEPGAFYQRVRRFVLRARALG